MIMRITLLFEPPPDRAIPFAAGPERYQRLVDELSRYVGTQVQIVKDVLQKAPTDTYVLFAGVGDLSRSLGNCGPALAAQLAPRIVLLDVSWQKALEQLEKYRLAGAVDSLRLSEWLARPSSCTGPFGLRYLTKSLGASCVPLPSFCSARYCLLESKYHRGMPHLLANYLAAYDRDQQPLSAVPSVSLSSVSRVLTEGTGENAQKWAGPRGRTTLISQVESVSIKRAIDSLKRARKSVRMTLPQLAERSGLDPEQLGRLEGSDYPRATLGTLRAYFLALEPTCGLTLAETGEPVFPPLLWTEEQVAKAKTYDSPFIVFGSGVGVEAADFSGPSPVYSGTSWMLVERGMTVLGNRRSRRRQPEGELGNPTVRTKEESYAGV
jgi:hypothetical protein